MQGMKVTEEREIGVHRREVVVSAGMVALLAALLGDRPEWWCEDEPFGRTQDIQAAAFTPDEEINIRVYRAASPAVVNITTIAVAMIFSSTPAEGRHRIWGDYRPLGPYPH